MKDARELSVRTIKRQVRQGMKRVEKICLELEALKAALPVPTLDEYARIAEGRERLSLETLLLGVICEARFHLSEASRIIEDYGGYSPSTVGRVERTTWRSDLLKSLGNVVKGRKGISCSQGSG